MKFVLPETGSMGRNMKEKNKQVNLKWGMRKLSVGLCSVVIGASVVPMMPAYGGRTIS